MDYLGPSRSDPQQPLQPPAVSPRPLDPLPRPLLLSRLERAPGPVLVAAPAGFGKTTLLRQFSGGSPDGFVWVRKDPQTQQTLAQALVEGLRRCPTIPGGTVARMSAHRDDPPEALRILADRLGGANVGIRLVVDGVDDFADAERDRWLAALIGQDGALIQLLMATRDSSIVDAGPARLEGRILELLADDLAFTYDETAALASRASPNVVPRHLHEVQRQTGGWPACVALTLRSLDESGDADAAAGDPAANVRELSDYLVRAVLPSLSAEEAHVLASTSVCRTVVAAQANALSGRMDAGGILSGLAGDRGLVEFAGRGRTAFRVRPVLRGYFRAELERKEPDELRRLHAAAADWHEAAGQPMPALRHAMKADAGRRVASLLQRDGATLLSLGGIGVVRRALADLTDTAVVLNPKLSLVAALANVEKRQPVTAARYLAAAERSWPVRPGRDLMELRALARARLLWFTDGWEDPLPLREIEDAALPASAHPGVRIEAMMVGVTAALAHGEYPAAEHEARTALAEANESGNAYLAGKILLKMAGASSMQGRMRRSLRLLEQAEQRLPSQAWATGPGRSAGSLMRAAAAMLRSEPAMALALARDGTADLGQLGSASEGLGAAMRSTVEIVEACARFDLGGGQGALDAMRRARTRMGGDHMFARSLSAWMAVSEYTAALAHGRTERAREVLDWAEERLPGTGELCVLRALGPGAAGRLDTAAERLRPVHDGTAVPLLAWTWLHVAIIECSLALGAGRRSLAFQRLEWALRLADRLDVLRPLANAPQEVIDLLAQRAGAHGPREALAMLVLARHPGAAPAEKLTPRQHEVLTLLPSHLSLEQISHELQLSVNTVKTHVRILYSKLGATSRHDAVAAAYKFGHLP